MMNKLGLIIVSVILALIQTGCTEQSTWMSLNSSNSSDYLGSETPGRFREHNRRADFYSGI